ncbi:MAG: bacteriocin [Cyanobacteria bacterium J06641_2]
MMNRKDLKLKKQQSIKQDKGKELSKLSIDELNNVNGGWWAASGGQGSSSW